MTNKKPTYADWQLLAEAALKGGSIADLARLNEDGIEIRPLYVSDGHIDGVLPDDFSAAAAPHSLSAQFIEPHSDADQLSRAMLDEVGGGTGRLLFTADQDLDILLDAAKSIESCPIGFYEPDDPIRAAKTLDKLWRSQDLDLSQASGCLGIDPSAFDSGDMAKHILPHHKHWTGLNLLAIGGADFHRSGLTAAAEIAACLSQIIMAMRQCETHGITPLESLKMMEFHLAFDADLYGGIAKGRAYRLLIGRLASASCSDMGDFEIAPRIHGFTSDRMLSRLDSDSNILRNGTAMLAARLSGVGILTALPHDWLTGSSAGGRRLARNSHHLLNHEALLGHPADPAQGSYFLDSLTLSLADKAWELMQKIEAAGGFASAASMIADWAAAAAENRQLRVNRGEVPLLGVTRHPSRIEPLADLATIAAKPRGGSCRPAALWEELRAEFIALKPRCLMLNIGKTGTDDAHSINSWLQSVGVHGAMMAADTIAAAQPIITAANPDVLIIGGDGANKDQIPDKGAVLHITNDMSDNFYDELNRIKGALIR